MTKVVGIDLGTTSSCVAVMEGKLAKVVENQEGYTTTPSVAAITAEGERLVGLPAKRQAITNPEGTFYGIKRLIGRRFDDPSVQKAKALLAYKTVEADNGDIWVEARNSVYSPAQVAAMVLAKLKTTAEDSVGEQVSKAVITVPAYFNDTQRQATKAAGEIAGLDVLRIIDEPTAAALAYGLEKKDGKTVAVYALGGGTFDVSVLEIGGGVLEVKSTNGDAFLGGEDFTTRLVEYIATCFCAESGVDVRLDKLTLRRVRDAAEHTKVELSSALTTEVNLPFITADSAGPKHLANVITRARLDELVDDLVQKTIGLCELALADANLRAEQIDEVVLVGGATRMPKIQASVKQLFNREPNKSVNPDEVVAIGAAIQAGVLQGEIKDVLLLGVTPLSLGIETLGGVFTRLINKNTTTPTKESQVFSTAEDNQSAVTIKVHQGEREMAHNNRLLGQFDLVGIPPAPRGAPRIEVELDVDANGMVQVSARDKGAGREQQMRIKASDGLTDAEIQAMMEDARVNAQLDEQRKRAAEARNQAEGLIYCAEKSLREHGDKLSEQDKRLIAEQLQLTQDALALENEPTDQLQSKTKQLTELSMKLEQAIRSSETAGAPADQAESEPPAD
ncbi:Heat shock protein 70 [Candidatus Hodgkinia cicadicola]|nr:Heat shock protein 70 [Candidatus Hodgkinia cicadicola]